MHLILRAFSLIFLIINHADAFGKQYYAVRGKFMCGDQPAMGVILNLYDEDKGKFVNIFI